MDCALSSDHPIYKALISNPVIMLGLGNPRLLLGNFNYYYYFNFKRFDSVIDVEVRLLWFKVGPDLATDTGWLGKTCRIKHKTGYLT
jgi:hypothetical protein